MARLLLKSGTSYFLPLYTQTWYNNGRRFQSHPPLFPGYIFVMGGPPARAAAFSTKLTVREVPVPDQDMLDRELSSVHHLMGGGESLRPEDRLSHGTRVLIATGTYAGVEGRVIEDEATDSLRVCVEISLLGCGVSVPVERWMLKTLETSHTLEL
jgi:transcription antitermination factor NusG